jgi:hypothetical protein
MPDQLSDFQLKYCFEKHRGHKKQVRRHEMMMLLPMHKPRRHKW